MTENKETNKLPTLVDKGSKVTVTGGFDNDLGLKTKKHIKNTYIHYCCRSRKKQDLQSLRPKTQSHSLQTCEFVFALFGYFPF